MSPAQEVASLTWPPLTPAAYLEDALVFCADGSLLADAWHKRASCGVVDCLGAVR